MRMCLIARWITLRLSNFQVYHRGSPKDQRALPLLFMLQVSHLCIRLRSMCWVPGKRTARTILFRKLREFDLYNSSLEEKWDGLQALIDRFTEIVVKF